MKTIILVWLDGTTEKVHAQYWRVKDGTLDIEIARDVWRYIPLTALREWKVTE